MRSTARTIRRASQRQIAASRALAEDLRKTQLQLTERPKAMTVAQLGPAELSPVPLALLSRAGVITSAAASLFRLLEAAPDQVLHKPLTELLRPRDQPALFKLLAHCLQTGRIRSAEFSMAVPGGSAKDIILVLSPLEPAQYGAALRAAFVDLGEIESRDFGPRPPVQNARLIEAIDGIVWEADYPDRFNFVSGQAERILGFSPEDWIRDPYFWEKHIHHEDRERVLQARAAAVRKPADHVLEYRMVTADRRTISVKDSAVILGGAPNWTRMCGIITDITDLDRTQNQLKQANENLEFAVLERTARMEQSLQAMETLCYGIAHDLKAPLRGLQGFITLLASEYEPVFKADAKSYVIRCQAALRRMGELIDSILMFGRLNHTLPELLPVHPQFVVQHILKSIEHEIRHKGARINVQMTLPGVIANPYLLEQVLTNLISNALKFSKPDAPPEISISGIQMQSQPATVRLTVTDNGIGIAPESSKRLFGMFQKLHRPEEYPGTGIGLALVKRAVELMNGRVGVFSESGQGSSFWVELPAASEK